MATKAELQKIIDQAKARLAAIEAREKAADRKARTRRAIILGEAVLTAISKEGTQVIDDAKGWLSLQKLRPQDRRVWGLD